MEFLIKIVNDKKALDGTNTTTTVVEEKKDLQKLNQKKNNGKEQE